MGSGIGKSEKEGRWLVWAVPFLMAITGHIYSLKATHIYDDRAILKNELPTMKRVRDFLIPPQDFYSNGYYRPLWFASFTFDMALIPSSEMDEEGLPPPFLFHLHSLLVHGLATLAFFWMAMVLLGKERGYGPALVASALFAMHPAGTEAVTWTAGRCDLYVALFSFLSLAFHAIFRQRGSLLALFLSGLLFACGLFMKESGMGMWMFFIVFGLFLSEKPVSKREIFLCLGTYGSVFAIYFALRKITFWQGGGTGLREGDLLHHLLSVINATGLYWRKILLASPLSPYTRWIPGGTLHASISAILLVLVGIVLVLALLKDGFLWKHIGFSLAFYMVALLPGLSVVFLSTGSAPVAERYLYLPLAGLCYGAGAFFSSLHRRKVFFLAALVPVLVLFFAISSSYTKLWWDRLAYWNNIVAENQDDATVRHNIGSEYLQRAQSILFRGQAGGNTGMSEVKGLLHQARYHLELATNPSLPYTSPRTRALAYNSLGVTWELLGDLVSAERCFFLARAPLNMGEGYPTPYYNLARIFMGRGEKERALEFLDRAIERKPFYANAYFLKGKLLEDLGRMDEALSCYRKAFEMDPVSRSGQSAQEKIRVLSP